MQRLSHLSWLVTLAFSSILLGPQGAHACRTTVDVGYACTSCGEEIPRTACAFTFCNGNDSCSTGYGECGCNHSPYSSGFASGPDCQGNGECGTLLRRSSSVSLNRLDLHIAKPFAYSTSSEQYPGQTRGLLPQLILVPSRCVGAFDLIDPMDRLETRPARPTPGI